MIVRKRRRLGGCLLVLTLSPVGVRAQTVAASFDDLQHTLKVGQSVVLTDDGGKARGTVEKLSTSSITIGAHTFSEATVREIKLRDPWWNGAVIGAAIGAGLAAWDYRIDPSEPGNAAVFTVAIGLGAAVGASIDALKGGKVIYRSSRQTARVTVWPIVERGRQSLLVSFRP